MSLNENNIPEIIDEMYSIAPYLPRERKSEFDLFKDNFSHHLPSYTEISINPYNDSIGIVTRGSGKEFIDRVKKYLALSGIDGKAIERFNEINKYFPDTHTLIKQDFASSPGFKFTLYWQYLVPVKILNKIASNYEAGRENLQLFNEISLLLRSRALYIGMTFKPPAEVTYKIYFSQNIRKTASYLEPAISAIMAKLGISAEAINYFIGFHNYLIPKAAGSVFISFDFGSAMKTGVNVDYEIIPPDYALEVCKALNIPTNETERLKETLSVIQMKNITYLGTRFTPGGLPKLKFYFDRRYSDKNAENAEILAELLKNTIWRL